VRPIFSGLDHFFEHVLRDGNFGGALLSMFMQATMRSGERALG
jgi:hypothetical protein